MKKILMPLGVAALVLAGCGSDGGGGGDVQGQAADLAVKSANAEGVDVDEDCVRDVASELSDEDAQAIVDAGEDGDAELSEEGEALRARLLGCVGLDELVDQIVAGMESSGAEVDRDCVADKAKDLDLSSLASSEEVPEEFVTAMMDCIDISSLQD